MIGLLASLPAGAVPESTSLKDASGKAGNQLIRTGFYASMAQELLNPTSTYDTLAVMLGAMDRIKVGVMPFEKHRSPIPVKEATRMNAGLIAALKAHAGSKYEIVSGEALMDAIPDDDERGLFAGTRRSLAALLEDGPVDLIIAGAFTPSQGGLTLSYKTVNVKTGHIVTQTSRFVPYDLTDPKDRQQAMSLSKAILMAADHFAVETREIQRLMVNGLRYETTGIQTAFGRHFTQQFVNQYDVQLAQVRVEGNRFRSNLATATPGAHSLSPIAPPNYAQVSSSQIYDFNGSYWNFGDVVEVRLNFERMGLPGLTWEGKILRSSIPRNVMVSPKTTFTDLRENDYLGPISLRLTTNRGPSPVFAYGEEMQVMVRSDADAHLYCFYKQSNGDMVKVFPNKFARESDVMGGQVVRIPDEVMPFEFRMAEPAGAELIKCFALDKPAGKHLPKEVASNDLFPIRPDQEARLSEIFRKVPDARISEASITATVVPR